MTSAKKGAKMSQNIPPNLQTNYVYFADRGGGGQICVDISYGSPLKPSNILKSVCLQSGRGSAAAAKMPFGAIKWGSITP